MQKNGVGWGWGSRADKKMQVSVSREAVLEREVGVILKARMRKLW